MKVTIIYDNTAYRKDLQSDWGFSALVEVDLRGPEQKLKRILFDTGADGKILLANMKKLAIDPASIDEIFISHLHSDHSGGLDQFLKVNPQIKRIYVPAAMGLKNEVVLKKPQKIDENVFSTGELEGIEQSMGVITPMGVILIVGCSHPYMGTILDAAGKFGKITAIVGGLHGFSEFELFKNLELICPTHCTQHKAELKKLYPQKYLEGGAGRTIEILE